MAAEEQTAEKAPWYKRTWVKVFFVFLCGIAVGSAVRNSRSPEERLERAKRDLQTAQEQAAQAEGGRAEQVAREQAEQQRVEQAAQEQVAREQAEQQRAEQAESPIIEPDANVDLDSDYDIGMALAALMMVDRCGYTCDSISIFREWMFSEGYTLRCNERRYTYRIHGEGRGCSSITMD